MRAIAFVFAVFGWLSGLVASASAQTPKPDYPTAYALATASYCAYAVGPKFEGKEQPDNGQDLAFRCVEAAGHRDPTLAKLGFTLRSKDDVFVSPPTGQGVAAGLTGGDGIDGFLLLDTPMGVVLAFRGTLLPPVSPDDPGDAKLGEVAKKAFLREKAREAWGAFLTDWFNNAFVQVDARQRHSGFDESWGRLREVLKPDCVAGAPAAGKFCAFLAEKNGTRPTLFVTGHSKGGALATLAGLDLAAALPNVPQRVFTFAAAKSVAIAAATTPAYSSRALWRFERAGDLVPTLPTDDSLPFLAQWSELSKLDPLGWARKLSPYGHFGPRVLYVDGKPSAIALPQGGRDAPDDWTRWRDIAKMDAPALLLFLKSRTLQIDGKFECPLVTDHLAIFADVQASAWPGGAPPAGVDAKSGHFFQYGLRDDDGKSVLPGYRDWCNWLNAF